MTVPERTERVEAEDLFVKNLGPCKYESPIKDRLGQRALHQVGQAERVLVSDLLSDVTSSDAAASNIPTFELAGPRDRLFFDPQTVRCGIVTCGGLCPGINNVVRGLVLELTHAYGVKDIFGFRYGFEGMVARMGHEPLRLVPDMVGAIHQQGGTVLGTSRGSQDPREMVDTLERLGIGALFVIGGDGTLRGATKILAEAERRGLRLAVVGIPKTIDNDIHFIDRSFGFESAFSAAVEAIRSAHVEATGALNGIGLVKLMGRHSGFIACHAALASTDVNFVLIPEVPLPLEGERGFLQYLERRLSQRGHAVVVVAEGAGQDLCTDTPVVTPGPVVAHGAGDDPGAEWARDAQPRTDASGNARLKDIGMVLRDRINGHFKQRGTPITLKYIDPSYQIRSVPASPSDSIYCWNLARNAVHAAMAGNTEMLIGRWHGRFVHVPLPLATRFRKQVDVSADLWMSVIESTGQPVAFG
ncbi:MAG: ATP-dependent 6-phosphofructokinase [Deltaproteobacteria bacterium]|nr:ATP-dependent 6-phosphofructokinase [Deltaproteobacteria bacterium]